MRRRATEQQSRNPEQGEPRALPLAGRPPFQVGLVGGLGLLVALLIGSMVTQLSTVLVYIGLALFLALGLDPLVSWLEKKLPRGAAIATVVVGAVLVFAGIILAIVPVLVKQIASLVEDVPGMISDIQHSEFYADIIGRYGDGIKDALNGAFQFLQDPSNLAQIGGGVFAVGAGVAGGVTGVIVVFILTLYFLSSLRRMKAVSARFVPAYRRPGFSEIVEDVSGAVGRYVIGQLSLALINGVLSFIMLSIIGAPLPALLALIAFFGSMIPLVGTISASIIITLACFLTSPVTALIAGIYYLVYMQIEAYVLSPRIMSKAVSVPGAIVVIAAVAGGALGGILGALVAIPVAASVMIIIQKLVFPTQDAKRTPPSKPESPEEVPA